MPPKKKVKKRKIKQKPTNTNINKQTVIVQQQAPVKRKYTRRKKTTEQPKSQFTTPESSFGQVFNLLRFIPQYQPPNYQSIQNMPKPLPDMLENRNYTYPKIDYDDDDAFSSVSGSTRDFNDDFKDDNIKSHKPEILSPVDEEDVFQAEEEERPKKINIVNKILKTGPERWARFDDQQLLHEEQKYLRSNPTNEAIKRSNLKKVREEITRRGLR